MRHKYLQSEIPPTNRQQIIPHLEIQKLRHLQSNLRYPLINHPDHEGTIYTLFCFMQVKGDTPRTSDRWQLLVHHLDVLSVEINKVVGIVVREPICFRSGRPVAPLIRTFSWQLEVAITSNGGGKKKLVADGGPYG